MNLAIDYFKKERVINVSVPKKDSKNLEKNNSLKEGCPGMMVGAVHSPKGKLPKWSRPAFTPSSDFMWEQDQFSLKTLSMER
jgi:hypothetical protein